MISFNIFQWEYVAVEIGLISEDKLRERLNLSKADFICYRDRLLRERMEEKENGIGENSQY